MKLPLVDMSVAIPFLLHRPIVLEACVLLPWGFTDPEHSTTK